MTFLVSFVRACCLGCTACLVFAAADYFGWLDRGTPIYAYIFVAAHSTAMGVFPWTEKEAKEART